MQPECFIPISDVYVAHVLNAVVMCWPMSIVGPGAFRTFPQSFRSFRGSYTRRIVLLVYYNTYILVLLLVLYTSTSSTICYYDVLFLYTVTVTIMIVRPPVGRSCAPAQDCRKCVPAGVP